MDVSTFYRTRKRVLEAIVSNNADDSDDGLDMGDDVADPDYAPETGVAFEIESYEGDDVGGEGSSQHQNEPICKKRSYTEGVYRYTACM